MTTHSSHFPIGKEFWADPEKVLKEEVYNSWHFNDKEGWGVYNVEKDSIKFQSFNYHTQEPCKRWLFEDRGLILNDSTILIYSVYSFNGKLELIKEPNIYGFYPTTKKPDSTNAWLYKRKWYKENEHKSR